MSSPEAPQPEAVSEVVRERSREELRENPPDPSQRQFLKTLFGSAAGLTGLAMAANLTTATTAEAAYVNGGATSPVPPYLPFPPPVTTGDQVNTNLQVTGHLAVKGYRPWVDVTAFGALGDGGDATAAVQAAFNSLPATATGRELGGVVYFPAGTYVLEAPITCSGKHICVRGAGRGATRLVWNSPGGFDFSLHTPNLKVTISDLLIQTNIQNPSPAIKISTVWNGGPTATPHIHDVYIGPNVVGSSWNKGIELINGSGAKIERFEIVCGTYDSIGIDLRGGSINDDFQGSSIANITSGLIHHVGTGVRVTERTEGTYIRGVEVVSAIVGYRLDSAKPGSAISDCHALTTEHGIYIKDHGEMALTGNLLYGTGPGGWTGIHAEGGTQGDNGPSARRLRIIGNAITNVPHFIDGVPQPPGPRIGIFMVGAAHDCTIQGNVLTQMAWGIVFSALETPPGSGVFHVGTNNNIVLGNRIQAAPGQHSTVLAVGTGNMYAYNLET